jgi:DNA polymerase-3 subunit delta'
MASLFAAEEEAELDEKVAELEAPEPVELEPRSNPDLSGHEDAEKALLADFNAGRMPHALILAGPEGIGKATLAFRLARFLLAQKEEGAGLFGEPEKPASLYIKADDPLFRRVASGGHADLLTVEREFDEKKGRLKNDISVDSVRKIAPFLRKTAAEGGWRAVIVDGAEALNASSQNALLKILEEPPSKTVLILTTTQPGLFLPTIRSRCRMLHLNALSEKTLTGLLDKMAPGAEEKATLCALAQGSIGRALRYHEEGGAALYKDLLKTASSLPALDLVAVHELADKIGRSEQQYETAREIMTEWCAGKARAEARSSGDARPALLAWEKISTLFRQTEIYNLDKRQALISAFLALQNPNAPGLNV